jgi:hypothetical protein
MADQQTLAFTIQGGGVSNINPSIGIGWPVTGATITPKTTTAAIPPEFYWVVILNAFQLGVGVVLDEFVIPGANNSTVPAGLDDWMSNPGVIFVVTTKQLSLQHVPTGAWYDFLIKYGAGRELQRLNQLSTTLQPGVFNGAGYVLIGEGGPRGGNNVPPPTYELSTITQPATILAMSLISTASGEGPYSLIDSYTVNTQLHTTGANAKPKGKPSKPSAPPSKGKTPTKTSQKKR